LTSVEHERDDLAKLVDLLTHAGKDVTRLSQLLQTARKKRRSVAFITERVKLALEGEYQPQAKYTTNELDIGLLAHRLGGHRILFALCEEYGLPSLRTILRKTVQLTVEPCLHSPDPETILTNIERVIISPRAHLKRPLFGFHFGLDETALRALVTYSYRWVAMAGMCPHSVDREASFIRGGHQNVANLANRVYDATVDKKLRPHLATQATVVAAIFHGEHDYRAQPFIVAGCCAEKDAVASRNLFELMIKTWDDSGAQEEFGWPFSIATDGDAARRKAGFDLLCRDWLNPNEKIWQRLHELVGLNTQVGPHNIVLDFDWKHIIKREFEGAFIYTGSSADGLCRHQFGFENY
jgi:hypothetical protein